MDNSTRKSLLILYYNSMIDLCDACGVVLKHERLYDNLRSPSPSSNSFKVIVKSHASSLELLGKKVERAKRKRAEIGKMVGGNAKALGLYPLFYDFMSDEVVELFCDKMMCRTEDTDFRKKVRDYSEQQLQHIANGEEVKPMSFEDYLNRYAQLVEDRRLGKRKRKKKTE